MNIDILTQGAFWTINKQLSKYVGIEAALFLSELISKQRYFENREECVADNGIMYFYFTTQSIEEQTTLTYSVQKKVIKILEKEEFIFTKLMGIPAKQHFAINENKISLFLNTSFKENLKLYIKNKYINNKDKEYIYTEDEKTIKCAEFVNIYHDVLPMLSKVSKITNARRNKVVTRLKEMDNNLETVKTVFNKIAASDFCCGKKNNWKADFDWIIANDTNWVKILEGKYDNKDNSTSLNLPIGAKNLFNEQSSHIERE